MIRELSTKPDFQSAIRRFDAWWNGRLLDRPPMNLWVKAARPGTSRPPQSAGRAQRDRWMDVRGVVDGYVARLEGAAFFAESLPIFWPNLGPEVTATLWGCALAFSESTSWTRPVVHSADEWQRILETPPDFENAYWQTIERMMDYAIERSRGRYLVGITDLHGNYDILAALRDPQELCTDMIDCPELVLRAARHVAQGYSEAFRRSHARLAAAGMGSVSWLSAYYEGPAYIPSCDFWCMVSPEMARDLVLPSIVDEMAPLERSIFHLDGPGALQHLDLLLDLPQLNAVQWVYGAGQGPASRWLAVYRRILDAGKGIQVIAESADDALTCLKALGPRGLWITIGEGFENEDAANSFIKEVEAMSRSR